MMNSFWMTSAFTLGLIASTAGAQGNAPVKPDKAGSQVPKISASEIDAHVKFLSSDLLEGRAPATRGGELTSAYIASQLQAAGVEPAGTNGYFQSVPINIVTTIKGTASVKASGKATANLRFPEDVVIWAGDTAATSTASGELVFVGYGADAPEYKWNDFKGMDLKGKVLLVLVNDPPAPASEPNLFGGKAMTYYGRWTYKFEEAERQGAAGMLIVHTTPAAGYGWNVVVGSNSTDHRTLPRDPKLPAPIAIRGWITDSAATALLAQAGLNLQDLRKQAESRDFKPVSTGIKIDASVQSKVASLESDNVVGVIRGSDPKLRDEYVLYTGHWDHLGIGPVVNGDSIYNGAIDNASGVGILLAMARAAASAPPTKRSHLFLFVTAEESGLLGSAYYGMNPTVPARNIIANLNVDAVSLYGRVNNLVVLGDTKSSLGPAIAEYIKPMGMVITPDAHPERGYFYRSDHFSLAKVGIPAVSVDNGSDVIGKPAGWGSQQGEEWTAKHYHQPSDDYRSDFNFDGAVQIGEIVLGFGRYLASSTAIPTWNADAEFKAIREASMRVK